MAGLVGTTDVPSLTPVAAEGGAAEGGLRPVYTWAGPPDSEMSGAVRSYTPSSGGAPRLVAHVRASVTRGHRLCVWDTGAGAFLGALLAPERGHGFASLVTYRRAADGRPRIAAGTTKGHLCIWDGDDLQVARTVPIGAEGHRPPVGCLVVYEEPTSGRTRLVSG
jgi:hypothetical protein